MLRLLALTAVLAGCAAAPPQIPVTSADLVGRLTLTPQDAGTDALLIAAHALSRDVVWAVGTGGTVVRTTDGGATWTAGVVPGADTLQFRDVHAFSAREAVVLSIGPGASSRVYRTEDAGARWTLTFVNPEAEGFFDCLAFWDASNGFAFSDSVDGRFLYAETSDGGRSWTLQDRLPEAATGEGGFASSGTCAATGAAGAGWIATGNAAVPRVLRTSDYGQTWRAAAVPLDGGDAAGATSLAFRAGPPGRQWGLAVGGSLAAPDAVGRTTARSLDGGQTWTAGGALPFAGAAYGAAWLGDGLGTRGTPGAALAVGPGGVAVTADGAATWALVSDETHWGLAVAPPTPVATASVAWLVGPEGRVTRVEALPVGSAR